MPPSGYSVQQTGHLLAFLSSCLDSLVSEADARGSTVADGLFKEVGDIQMILNDSTLGPYQRSVLAMTQAFYSDLAVHRPVDEAELAVAVTPVVESFRRAILGIHVPG
jgi:hypothetical protein